MYKTIRIKKRHNGLAEVRSYVFDAVKEREHGLKFVYVNPDGEIEGTMTVPYKELDRGFVTARGIKSKIVKGQVFNLISFTWEDDQDRKKREKENAQLNIFDRLYPNE